MTAPIGQFVDTTIGRTSTNPFITMIKDRPPTGNDGINNGLQVGQRWIDIENNNDEYFLLSFISSNGAVQANWILLTPGVGTIETLAGNSGGAVGPAMDGTIDIVGDGTTGGLFVGDPAANSLTLTLNAIPNSALAHSSISLVAGTGITISSSPVSLGGSTTISAASSTVVETVTGNSGGAVSPTSGNINIVGDGTTIAIVGNPGTHTLTASLIGSAGLSSVKTQTFTTTGTYTPTAGMTQCIIEVVGGGGGGGSLFTNALGSNFSAGGGGGGGYARGLFSAATIGASQVVTIGAGGAGGAAAGANNGATGGTTSVGSLIGASGGIGGQFDQRDSPPALGGGGGTGTGGDFVTTGTPGFWGMTVGLQLPIISGFGGSTFFGGGAPGVSVLSTGPTSAAGLNGTSYGGGGSGAASIAVIPSVAGGNGFAGIVIVTEFVG